MTELSEADLDELIGIFERKYGKTMTREEAREAGRNLLGFFECLMDIDQRQRQAQTKAGGEV